MGDWFHAQFAYSQQSGEAWLALIGNDYFSKHSSSVFVSVQLLGCFWSSWSLLCSLSDEFPHFPFPPFCLFPKVTADQAKISVRSRVCRFSTLELLVQTAAMWSSGHILLPGFEAVFSEINVLKSSVCLRSPMFCQIGPDSISIWCLANPSSKQWLDGARPRVPLANSLSHTGGEHLVSSGKAGDQSCILPISFHFDVSPFRERTYPLSAVQPDHPEGPAYSRSHRLWVVRHREPSGQRSGAKRSKHTHTVLKITHFILKEKFWNDDEELTN